MKEHTDISKRAQRCAVEGMALVSRRKTSLRNTTITT